MGKVNVIIVDATGNKEQKVGLPDDIKCGIIMVKLVEKIKLPSVGPDGNPISYKFIHKVTGRQLLEAQTLGEAGIKDGDVLRLQPEITAGAVCGNCGNTEADGEAFCSKCGTPLAATPVQPTQAYTPVQPTYTSAPGFNPTQVVSVVKQKVNGKTACILGMISGILSVIFGLITLCLDKGSFEGSISYGGDAYTGIQNAAAQTANNIQDLARIVSFGLGFLLIFFGIFTICYFVIKISKLPNSK